MMLGGVLAEAAKAVARQMKERKSVLIEVKVRVGKLKSEPM